MVRLERDATTGAPYIVVDDGAEVTRTKSLVPGDVHVVDTADGSVAVCDGPAPLTDELVRETLESLRR